MNKLENIVYTVNDLASAKAIHAVLLGVEPHTDQPYYVGFNVGGVEIGLTPKQNDASVGSVAHVLVQDIEATLADLQSAGAAIVAAPRQVSPGTRIAAVSDADGTVLGLIEHSA